jgi:hypothetical protein
MSLQLRQVSCCDPQTSQVSAGGFELPPASVLVGGVVEGVRFASLDTPQHMRQLTPPLATA